MSDRQAKHDSLLTADDCRVMEACRTILDGRDPQRDMSEILVTAEHTIAVPAVGSHARPEEGGGNAE